MKVAVRKVQIEDAAKLQMLVAENIDGIEPGLVVLDSRLLLGHATIDVVGVDANGALVLIATGLTANEEMLLKAVEAYSWSREYPESLERLYPTCVISDERPPRLVFVVERMPDAFHRKIKQLGFPEVDCVEFRLLDVDGAPAVYFESVLRLRRPTATAPAPAPAIETTPEAPASPENVIALNGPVAARATSLKLQKLLNQAAVDGARAPRASERPVMTSREPASVVSLVGRHATAAAPCVELPRPEPTLGEATPIVNAAPAIVRQPEPVVVPGPVILTPEPTIATPEPVVVAPAPVIVTPEPVVLPRATAAPDDDLIAQLQRALAAVDATAATPEPIEVVEPALAVEPTLELVSEAAPAPKLELELEPRLELVSEPVAAVEPASAPSIPSLAAPSAVPSMAGERISLRSLPELSLRPAAPVTVPRPAPIATTAVEAPSVAPATPPAAGPQEPRVSFKDLSAALLGDAPVAATPAVAPVAPTIEPTPSPTLELVTATDELIVEPVSEAMADAVAELEPALTVEALIKSALDTPAPAAAAPVVAAPAEAPAPQPAKPAAALPLEFAGLQFPKDGVMTRQWMEFLSQMSNTK